MDITRRDVGPVTVLDLSGRLTGTDSHGTLKQHVTQLVTDGRKHIVLNLENLTYMDSGGLGEMVSCYTTASKAGQSVCGSSQRTGRTRWPRAVSAAAASRSSGVRSGTL